MRLEIIDDMPAGNPLVGNYYAIIERAMLKRAPTGEPAIQYDLSIMNNEHQGQRVRCHQLITPESFAQVMSTLSMCGIDCTAENIGAYLPRACGVKLDITVDGGATHTITFNRRLDRKSLRERGISEEVELLTQIGKNVIWDEMEFAVEVRDVTPQDDCSLLKELIMADENFVDEPEHDHDAHQSGSSVALENEYVILEDEYTRVSQEACQMGLMLDAFSKLAEAATNHRKEYGDLAEFDASDLQLLREGYRMWQADHDDPQLAQFFEHICSVYVFTSSPPKSREGVLNVTLN